MFGFLRSRSAKCTVAAITVLLGMAISPAGAAPTSSAPPAPPGLDHFLCYKATAVGFQPPPGVMLTNQFSPNGFVPVIGPVKSHCNPTEKQVPAGVFPITNPDAHLLCFKISAPLQPTPTVVVKNQFGRAVLDTSQPTSLCLPSWKSLTGPPNKTPVQPPGLDHFTCYPVAYHPGSGTFRPPSRVLVGDQFNPTGGLVPVTVGAPKELCLPTQKTVNGVVFPITNPAAHLLCFKVSSTPIISPVFDQNQFGTGQVSILATKRLCLPSSKKIG